MDHVFYFPGALDEMPVFAPKRMMEEVVIFGISYDQILEVIIRKDVSGFPCPLTIGPFNQDVEWASVVFRVFFGDRFMI